jgi:hypothetical protein
MANRTRVIDIYDWTGGLSLREESFQLAPNETPEILNMEIDARGGVFTRRGWERWNTTAIGGTWNPRSAYLHETAAGVQYVVVSNATSIYSATAGTFAQITGVTVGADPHLADYASWGDTLYVACGRANVTCTTTGTGAGTTLTHSGTGAWQDDYATPTGTHAPKAELICAHQGYMFVANVNEATAGDARNRLRWSHPNQPQSWHSMDYLDILEGGSEITALFSFADHLLICKTDSVWGLYGYDADSWQLVNITRKVGAVTQQAATQSPNAVYFYSFPLGVFRYDGREVTEVSKSLSYFLQSPQVVWGGVSSVWMGWIQGKLWMGFPYDPAGSTTSCKSVFVYDPHIVQRTEDTQPGAWTVYRGADGNGLGPFVEVSQSGGSLSPMAFSRSVGRAMKLDALDVAKDNDTSGSTQTGFQSAVRTNWQHMGYPTLRKSWRRPDFVLRDIDVLTSVTWQSYTNYDSRNSSRTGTLTHDPNATAVYGSFNWGDGTSYGSAGASAPTIRGKTLGIANSMMLRLSAAAGTRWGVNAIIFKIVPRRLK